MQTELNLQNLSKLVAEQRNCGGFTRFTEEVWEKVKVLRRKHTISEISQATGLAKSHISTNSKKQRKVFCEINPVPIITKKESALLELKRIDGAELKLRLNCSQQDIAELISGFLR